MVETSPDQDTRQGDQPHAGRSEGKGKDEGVKGRGNRRGRLRAVRKPRHPEMCKYGETGCPRESCPYAHTQAELAAWRNRTPAAANDGREPRTQDYDEAQWRGEKVASTVRGNRLRAERERRSWKEKAPDRSYYPQAEQWAEAAPPAGVPAPLPRDSVSRKTLQQISALVPCKHSLKGCAVLSAREEVQAHLDTCPFERCKDHLVNGQIDAILRYFKKEIGERDKLIQELRSQCSQTFKEEEEKFGVEEEQVSLFKELILKTTPAAKIAGVFGERYPAAEWSVFIHHASESDLSYIHDGCVQWVFKGRRHVLVKLNKPEEEALLA